MRMMRGIVRRDPVIVPEHSVDPAGAPVKLSWIEPARSPSLSITLCPIPVLIWLKRWLDLEVAGAAEQK
jgi:hypothetical protein